MKRIFTFGCSFTSYFWPTWADILIEEYKNQGYEGYNFGRCGAGNQYIFTKLIEANIHYNFNENDVIIVAWSSIAREDRFKNGEWFTSGNIFSQNVISKDFVDQWANPDHYMVRDYAIVSGTKFLMNSLKCKFINFSLNDFSIYDYNIDDNPDLDKKNINAFYGNNLKMDAPNMFENAVDLKSKRPIVKIIINGEDGTSIEHHPTPSEHLEYTKKYLLPLLSIDLSPKTIDFVNEWISKIDGSTGLISHHETGWKVDKDYFDFFVV